MRWRSGEPSGEEGYTSEFCRDCPERTGGTPCAACPENDLQLLPENAKAAEAFLLSSSQWRAAPMGGLIGYDMTGVKSVLEMAGVVLDREDLAKLQAMERETTEIVNARLEAKRAEGT